MNRIPSTFQGFFSLSHQTFTFVW